MGLQVKSAHGNDLCQTQIAFAALHQERALDGL
jgi:hypothetical protein